MASHAVTNGSGTAATPARSAKPKISLGALKPVVAADTKGKTAYPILPDPTGLYATIAVAFLDANEKMKAAEAAKKSAGSELSKAARPFHFQTNAGRLEPASSVAVHCGKGEVRVTFKNRYPNLDEAGFNRVVQTIGGENADAFFVETYEFTIDSEKVPSEKLQATVDGINELAARLGIGDAVTVKSAYKPTPQFHEARFSKLTVEQNNALEYAIDPEKGFAQCAISAAR